MRFYCAVLIATTVVATFCLSPVDGSSATVSDFSVRRVHAAGQEATTVSAKRAGEVETEDDHEEEERGVTSSFLLKLQNVFKSGAAGKHVPTLTPQSELSPSMLAKQQQYLDDAFTRRKLDKVNVIDDNLFENKALKKWIHERKLFNKQNGIEDTTGYEILSKYFKQDELVGMIERAKRSQAKRNGAKRSGETDLDQFRNDQISYWLHEKLSVAEAYKLLQVRGDFNRDLWRNYLIQYNKKWISNPTV